jgi:hypothetical protein
MCWHLLAVIADACCCHESDARVNLLAVIADACCCRCCDAPVKLQND